MRKKFTITNDNLKTFDYFITAKFIDYFLSRVIGNTSEDYMPVFDEISKEFWDKHRIVWDEGVVGKYLKWQSKRWWNRKDALKQKISKVFVPYQKGSDYSRFFNIVQDWIQRLIAEACMGGTIIYIDSERWTATKLYRVIYAGINADTVEPIMSRIRTKVLFATRNDVVSWSKYILSSLIRNIKNNIGHVSISCDSEQ